MSITEDLAFILANYIEAKNSADRFRSVRSAFASLQEKIRNLAVVKNCQNIIVKFGTGIGGVASVPWLALLDKEKQPLLEKELT